jgi:DNA-binding transcriptional ArsR family regulator
MDWKKTVMLDENVNANFVPAEEMTIDDLETLKVLADPLRLTILEYLMKPSTVKRIAEKIDKPATKLYYHFNLLEKHNLIQLVDTRIVSGIIEKHYQASARAYRVARGLLTPGEGTTDEGLEITLSSLFADMKNDIMQSIRDGVLQIEEDKAKKHRGLNFSTLRLNLTDEQAKEFYERLTTLLREYSSHVSDTNEHNPDAMLYKMLFVLHPSSRTISED